MYNFKDVLILLNQGYSHRYISSIQHISRDRLRYISSYIEAHKLDYYELVKLSNVELEAILFPKKERESIFEEPNIEELVLELKKKGVTMKLLWEEYKKDCINRDKIYYQYSSFRKKFAEFTRVHQARAHFNHNPAEKIEVDYAGGTINIANPNTGQITKAYLFVGVLPYSQYTYAEFTENMKLENWIQSHVNMFEYFGGSTPIIISDNLKAGVISNKKNEDPVLNVHYNEAMSYYNATIVPAEPLTPKGKPSAEGNVGKLTTQILARLRNTIFNSIYEANLECNRLLEEFNNKPYQKREGSRYDVYKNEEKDLLQSLPKVPFGYGEQKICKVQKNYHISVLKQNYSVPFKYIGTEVKVKVTTKMIYVYANNDIVTSHMRLQGRNYQYSTKEEHLPKTHIQANNWNGDYFRRWANAVGPNTYTVVDRLLKSYSHEQQGYKGVNSLLCLGNNYGKLKLESAFERALSLVSIPRYNNIKKIIEVSQDIEDEKRELLNENSYMRGNAYFGKDEN